MHVSTCLDIGVFKILRVLQGHLQLTFFPFSLFRFIFQLFESILLTLPRQSGGGGKSSGEIMEELAADILSKFPPPFKLDEVIEKYPVLYTESMNTVLRQELIRFNRLTDVVRATLVNLQKAIKVMTHLLFSANRFFRLFFCLPVFICPFVRSSFRLFACPSVNLSVRSSVHLSVHLSVGLLVRRSFPGFLLCPSVCFGRLFVYLFAFRSFSLSVSSSKLNYLHVCWFQCLLDCLPVYLSASANLYVCW